MKYRGWSAVIIGLCLGAIFLSLEGQHGGQTTMDFSPFPAAAQNDWTEEHEANGPAGGQGVPMRRLPVKGACLAVAILLAATGLSAIEKKRQPSLLVSCKSGE